MSSRERIENSIKSLSEDFEKLVEDIELIKHDLTDSLFSEEDKNSFRETLDQLMWERDDLSLDIAMLRELLMRMDEETEMQANFGYGLDWNESGYFD